MNKKTSKLINKRPDYKGKNDHGSAETLKQLTGERSKSYGLVTLAPVESWDALGSR